MTGTGGILFDQANGVQASGKKGASITGLQDGSDVNSMGITFNVHGTDGNANREEAMRIDSSGRLLLGTTTFSAASNGILGHNDGRLYATATSQAPLNLNRLSSDGDIALFAKAGTTVGSIGNSNGSSPGDLFICSTTSGHAGIGFGGGPSVNPTNNAGALSDNTVSLGLASHRFDDAFITNGVTTGSDLTEKQDIAALTSTEMLVAARISQTFHTYRWKDAVADKGDDARIHTGTIAQEVQAAFAAEGLDAGDYAMFMSDTWWEQDVDVPAVEAVAEVTETTTDEDGNDVVTVTTEAVEAVDAYTRTDTYDTQSEAPAGATSKTRMGIRYPELLSFVAAYNEQRFAAIETRLTALEG